MLNPKQMLMTKIQMFCTTVSGGNGGDTIVGGGFFLAHKVNHNLGLGLSLTSPYGGAIDCDDA